MKPDGLTKRGEHRLIRSQFSPFFHQTDKKAEPVLFRHGHQEFMDGLGREVRKLVRRYENSYSIENKPASGVLLGQKTRGFEVVDNGAQIGDGLIDHGAKDGSIACRHPTEGKRRQNFRSQEAFAFHSIQSSR